MSTCCACILFLWEFLIVFLIVGIWMQPVDNLVKKTNMSLFQCLHFATCCSSVMQFFSRQAVCNICHVKINNLLKGYHHLFLCHYTEFLKCMVPKCDISSQSKPSFNIKEVTFVAVITHKVKIKDFSIKDDL